MRDFLFFAEDIDEWGCNMLLREGLKGSLKPYVKVR